MSAGVAVRWAEVDPSALARDLALLDAEQQHRADGIRHPAARTRFVAAHATLRRLAADLLGEAPQHVRLSTSPGSPPVVRAHGGWRASLAHTRDLVVAAVRVDGAIGVDVERRDRRGLPPVERWCSPLEITTVGAADLPDRRRLLLRLWTGKEAVLKAGGATGPPTAPARIEVLGPSGPVWAHGRPGPRPGQLWWPDWVPDHVIAIATFDDARA